MSCFRQLAVTLVALSCVPFAVHAQQVGARGRWQTYDTSNGEWRSYAGDIGGRKY